MIDRKEAHRLLDKLLDAIELERAANSNECRAQAQADYLKARDALLRRVGGVDVERKRMEIEVLGLPAGSPVDPTDFEQFADRYVKGSPEDENRLRLVLARHAQDHSDLLTTRFAGVFSDTMLRNYEGRYRARRTRKPTGRRKAHSMA